MLRSLQTSESWPPLGRGDGGARVAGLLRRAAELEEDGRLVGLDRRDALPDLGLLAVERLGLADRRRVVRGGLVPDLLRDRRRPERLRELAGRVLDLVDEERARRRLLRCLRAL